MWGAGPLPRSVTLCGFSLLEQQCPSRGSPRPEVGFEKHVLTGGTVALIRGFEPETRPARRQGTGRRAPWEDTWVRRGVSVTLGKWRRRGYAEPELHACPPRLEANPQAGGTVCPNTSRGWPAGALRWRVTFANRSVREKSQCHSAKKPSRTASPGPCCDPQGPWFAARHAHLSPGRLCAEQRCPGAP